MARVLICIPTYNEAENIRALVFAIARLNLAYDILVIDDSSPDGTAQIVQDQKRYQTNLSLINRSARAGLASAYRTGFEYGLARNYDIIGQMDADFSHHPSMLIEVDRLIRTGKYDFLVGSRYVKGGKILNWSRWRQAISRFGSYYVRRILDLPLQDLTGGFNFWSRQTLLDIQIERIKTNDYVFQIELKARAGQLKKTFVEFPITFEDRRVGQSRVSSLSIIKAIYQVIALHFNLKKSLARGNSSPSR